MLARIFSSVLLPEPFWPTMPKNSPLRTSKETSRSARSWRYSARLKGCVARSFNVSTRCSGTLNALLTPRASIATGASIPGIVAGTVDRRLIAFGSAITKPDMYRRAAEPGIRRASEPDSVVFDLESTGTLAQAYNRLLDLAAAHDPAAKPLVLVL